MNGGSTGLAARFSVNRSFVCSVMGALQIGVVVSGFFTVSILAGAMTTSFQNYASFWVIGGFSFYAFLFLVSFWCFMTSFIVLITCVYSSATASVLPSTIFFLTYHVLASAFYLFGTLALLVEAGKYSTVTYGEKRNIQTLVFVGGSSGGIVTGLYIFISVFSIGKYIHSS